MILYLAQLRFAQTARDPQPKPNRLAKLMFPRIPKASNLIGVIHFSGRPMPRSG